MKRQALIPNMKTRIILLSLTACALAVPALAQHPTSPYAGQENRAIKALSDDDIAALIKGEGMGMAKAAELNGYPGPKHVLSLAKQLQLTDSQRQQIDAIFVRMNAAAKPLGSELIQRERVLDQLFARKEITAGDLAAETARIGELEGRLRSVHLSAHLETRALLTPEQIARYEQLRGYDDRVTSTHHHHE